jgi:hypothetical protein
LLYVKNIKIPQNKWYRNFSDATIDVEAQIYTLAATENKRELIIDSTGKLIGTKPYMLEEGVKFKKEREILYYLSTLLVSFKYLAIPAPKNLLSLPSNNIEEPIKVPKINMSNLAIVV